MVCMPFATTADLCRLLSSRPSSTGIIRRRSGISEWIRWLVRLETVAANYVLTSPDYSQCNPVLELPENTSLLVTLRKVPSIYLLARPQSHGRCLVPRFIGL